MASPALDLLLPTSQLEFPEKWFDFEGAALQESSQSKFWASSDIEAPGEHLYAHYDIHTLQEEINSDVSRSSSTYGSPPSLISSVDSMPSTVFSTPTGDFPLLPEDLFEGFATQFACFPINQDIDGMKLPLSGIPMDPALPGFGEDRLTSTPVYINPALIFNCNLRPFSPSEKSEGFDLVRPTVDLASNDDTTHLTCDATDADHVDPKPDDVHGSDPPSVSDSLLSVPDPGRASSSLRSLSPLSNFDELERRFPSPHPNSDHAAPDSSEAEVPVPSPAPRTRSKSGKKRKRDDDDDDTYSDRASDHDHQSTKKSRRTCSVSLCTATFGRWSDLKRHMWFAANHQNAEDKKFVFAEIGDPPPQSSHQCQHCKEVLSRADALKRHLQDGACFTRPGRQKKKLSEKPRKGERKL